MSGTSKKIKCIIDLLSCNKDTDPDIQFIIPNVYGVVQIEGKIICLL